MWSSFHYRLVGGYPRKIAGKSKNVVFEPESLVAKIEKNVVFEPESLKAWVAKGGLKF